MSCLLAGTAIDGQQPVAGVVAIVQPRLASDARQQAIRGVMFEGSGALVAQDDVSLTN